MTPMTSKDEKILYQLKNQVDSLTNYIPNIIKNIKNSPNLWDAIEEAKDKAFVYSVTNSDPNIVKVATEVYYLATDLLAQKEDSYPIFESGKVLL